MGFEVYFGAILNIRQKDYSIIFKGSSNQIYLITDIRNMKNALIEKMSFGRIISPMSHDNFFKFGSN